MRTLRAANPSRASHNTVKRTSLGGTPLEERLDYGCKGRCDPSITHFRGSKGKDLRGESSRARAFRASDFKRVLSGDLGRRRRRSVLFKDGRTSRGRAREIEGGRKNEGEKCRRRNCWTFIKKQKKRGPRKKEAPSRDTLQPFHVDVQRRRDRRRRRLLSERGATHSN